MIDPLDIVLEDQMLTSILKVAREDSGRWMAYHDIDSRRSEPGYPDLNLVETVPPSRILYVELKTQKGKYIKGKWTKPRRRGGKRRWLPGQDEWAVAIRRCPGVEYHLIRPSDLEWFYQLLMGDLAANRGG